MRWSGPPKTSPIANHQEEPIMQEQTYTACAVKAGHLFKLPEPAPGSADAPVTCTRRGCAVSRVFSNALPSLYAANGHWRSRSKAGQEALERNVRNARRAAAAEGNK